MLSSSASQTVMMAMAKLWCRDRWFGVHFLVRIGVKYRHSYSTLQHHKVKLRVRNTMNNQHVRACLRCVNQNAHVVDGPFEQKRKSCTATWIHCPPKRVPEFSKRFVQSTRLRWYLTADTAHSGCRQLPFLDTDLLFPPNTAQCATCTCSTVLQYPEPES